MKNLTLFLASALLLPAIAMSAADEGTLEKIAQSKQVTVGVRDSSPPLSYAKDSSNYVGYQIDVCNKLVSAIRSHLKLKELTIKYMPVTSQNRIPLVQNGTVDIECGTTTNNLARQKDVAFANTTYVTEVRMATKADSKINSIKDLNGKTVSTTTGTTSVQLLRKNKRAENVDFKEVNGKDHSDSFSLLETGRADVMVMDDNILAGLIANSKNPSDYKIVGEPLSTEPIAIMIRKDDPKFKKLIDGQIVSMAKDGELTQLYSKWFLKPIPPKNAIVGLPMNDVLKGLIAKPNDEPVEEYKKKEESK